MCQFSGMQYSVVMNMHSIDIMGAWKFYIPYYSNCLNDLSNGWNLLHCVYAALNFGQPKSRRNEWKCKFTLWRSLALLEKQKYSGQLSVSDGVYQAAPTHNPPKYPPNPLKNLFYTFSLIETKTNHNRKD